jgi:RNA polymerase sigma-70 factor (ECF subfamily)
MGNEVNQLVRQAKNGDRSAFGQLVRLYEERMIYLGYQILGNWEDARDAAQNTFVKAYEHLSGFQEKAQFSTWLYRIMVNQCRDLQRKKARSKLADISNEEMLEAAEALSDWKSDKDNIQNKLENDETRKVLEDALQALSVNQRTAVSLRYFQNYSTAEIAEVMQCSETTVRIHLFRGLNKLKTILEKK